MWQLGKHNTLGLSLLPGYPSKRNRRPSIRSSAWAANAIWLGNLYEKKCVDADAPVETIYSRITEKISKIMENIQEVENAKLNSILPAAWMLTVADILTHQLLLEATEFC
jgi:hypothetical protein